MVFRRRPSPEPRKKKDKKKTEKPPNGGQGGPGRKTCFPMTFSGISSGRIWGGGKIFTIPKRNRERLEKKGGIDDFSGGDWYVVIHRKGGNFPSDGWIKGLESVNWIKKGGRSYPGSKRKIEK